MRLSCLPVSLYDDLAAGRIRLDDWFRLAARLGLDGADVSVAHIRDRSAAHLDALRAQAAEHGVVIAMLASYTDFTQPHDAARAEQALDVRAWIDACARLEAPMLRVTAGQAHPEVAEADGLRWAAEGLTSALDHARAAGVRLVFENHVRGSAWPRHDFTQPARRFLDVVRRTEGASLEVLFDTANNLALGENPLPVFDAVSHRLGAVHVSDIRRSGTFEPVRIGTGAAPLQPLFNRIVASGFDGWVSIEEASRSGPEAFAQAVAFVDEAWVRAGGAARVRLRARADG